MGDAKTERQLNLLFVLLNAKFPIEREEIRKRVPGYFGKSNEAFERMFERDKEDLRDLGIPIEALPTDVFHEDNFGYLIKTKDWLMPEISLTSEERALLNVAASAWTSSQTYGQEIGNALTQAVQKLTTREIYPAKFEMDLARQATFLEVIAEAKSQGKCVEFNYFSIKSKQETSRTVAPWRIFLSRGQSYLIGFDQNKGEERVFKLSRIVTQVTISNETAIEDAPANLNVNSIIEKWESYEPTLKSVQVRVAKEVAGELRILANDIEYGHESDLLTFEKISIDQISKEILRNCDVVEVITPSELKDLINYKLSFASIYEK